MRTELAASLQAARDAATRDDLTGMCNRRSFTETLAAMIARSEQEGQIFCLLLCDLDHFKSLNDQHGHQVGDEALRSVAVAIQTSIRARDVSARYGGEEFTVLVRGGIADGLSAASHLRAAVARVRVLGTPLSISVGVASYGSNDTPESLLKRADEALYRAKRGGRDRVRAAT